MPLFNELEENVLRFLKDEYVEKGGEPKHMQDSCTSHQDVLSNFDLSDSQYRELMARFESLGIAKPIAIEASNGWVKIFPEIVEIVHQLDNPRDEQQSATVNLLQVDSMHHSQIQQGNIGSTQSGSFSSNDLAEITALVNDLRREIAQLELSGDDATVAQGDIETIEREVASPRPKSVVIRECLRSLRGIFEGAIAGGIGGAIAPTLVNGIQQILDKF